MRRKVIATGAGSAAEIKKRLDQHDADARILSYAAEIAAETKAQLETRIAGQRDSEAARELAENYNKAKAQRDEVAAAVVPELRKISSAARALLRKLAQAQLAVDRANAALPPGAEMIPNVESERWPAAIPPRVQTRKLQMFIDDKNRRIADFGSAEAEKRPDGKFDVKILTGSTTGARVEIHTCALVDFVEAITTTSRRGLSPLPIAEELSIPQISFDEHPGWRPISPAYPELILNALDRLEKAPKPVPVVSEYPSTRLVRADEWAKEQAQHGGAVHSKDLAAA